MLEEDEVNRYIDVPGSRPKRILPAPPKIPQQDPRMKDNTSAYSSAYRINDFIKNVIPNIVDEKGNHNEITQYTIINRLRGMFTNKVQQIQPPTATSQSAKTGIKPSQMLAKRLAKK